jgi:hypothetical protein
MSNLPIKPKTAAERLDALARSASNVTLLKYNVFRHGIRTPFSG